jgi:putative molybdopterin biosynthesis protein
VTADGGRLRLARQARGLSQQQLAGMAGVSRQAVSAVESGVSDPSLRVALALARALGVSIEEVFGPAEPSPPVTVRPLAPLGVPGSRVAVAPVSDAFVAFPLSDTTAGRAGFAPAGGLVDAAGPDLPSAAGQPGSPAGRLAQRRVRPVGPPRPTLLVAGCDPAMPLLEAPLSLLDPPVAFAWWPCGSEEALGLAAAGLVHAAGAHLRGASGDYNTAAAAESLPGGAEVIGFCAWREGLVLRPGLAGRVTGVADLAADGLRLVNREPGAEARYLLDRELARLGIDPVTVAGYDTRVSGHLEVAAAVAAGLADAGIASEPAALAYHLEFVPVAAEVFDWVIPAGQSDSREVQCLLRVLSSPWLLEQLANLPGYDPARCGRHIATLPAASRRGLAARAWRPSG